VKTKLSHKASFKNRQSKSCKQSCRARLPSKTASLSCKSETFVRDFFSVRLRYCEAVRLLCCKTSLLWDFFVVRLRCCETSLLWNSYDGSMESKLPLMRFYWRFNASNLSIEGWLKTCRHWLTFCILFPGLGIIFAWATHELFTKSCFVLDRCVRPG